MGGGATAPRCCSAGGDLFCLRRQGVEKKDNYSLRQGLRKTDLLLSRVPFDPPNFYCQVKSRTQKQSFPKTYALMERKRLLENQMLVWTN